MVKIVNYSHDWAEIEMQVKGKPKRCEVRLKNDLFQDKKAHREELEQIMDMDITELRKRYGGCRK